MIHFPELHRESTQEAIPIMALSILASAILLPASWILSVVALLPFLVICSKSLLRGYLNRRIRREWASEFPRRLAWEDFQRLVSDRPTQYVVHLKHYSGFDAVSLKPAAILEDRESRDLMAIHPASRQVSNVCQQFGLEVMIHPSQW